MEHPFDYTVVTAICDLKLHHIEGFLYTTKNGKCTSQCVGINTLGKMPSEIAAFIGLTNPEQYIGHSFRRSAATILADSGEEITNIKRLGGNPQLWPKVIQKNL